MIREKTFKISLFTMNMMRMRLLLIFSLDFQRKIFLHRDRRQVKNFYWKITLKFLEVTFLNSSPIINPSLYRCPLRGFMEPFLLETQIMDWIWRNPHFPKTHIRTTQIALPQDKSVTKAHEQRNTQSHTQKNQRKQNLDKYETKITKQHFLSINDGDDILKNDIRDKTP